MNDEQPSVFAETTTYSCREYVLSRFFLSSVITSSSDHGEDKSTLSLRIALHVHVIVSS
jgi:hypothetical protein